ATFTENDDVLLVNPALSGWTFDGWYDASTDGKRVSGWDAGTKTDDVELWARWNANRYTVILSNDGNTKGTESVTATFDAMLPNITIPRKTGFQFAGYYTENKGNGTKCIDKDGYGCFVWNITDDTTLYADWLENGSHFITYNNADGCDNSVNAGTFKESLPVTIYNITKAGYIFDGWYDAENGGTIVTGWGAGEKTGNVELYARWTAIIYTVTFNANGGSGAMQPQTFTYDVSQDLSVFALTAPAYMKFQDWNTKADGTGTAFSDGQNVKNLTDKSETIMLYAQWVDKAAHTICYHNIKTANNGNNQPTFLEKNTVTLFNLTLDGYTFDGWYDASTDGMKVEGWGAGTKTADVDVWAYWTPLVYQLSYKDENGNNLSGTLTDPPTTHTYGTDTPLVSPTKKYYDFLGWHKQSNCADNSIDTIGAETILSDTTLYAKWALHNYKIIYHNLYNADNTNRQTFTINDSVTLSNITVTGRTFGGWWTAENSGSQVAGWSAGAKKDDVEVWARWTPNTYTITYKDMNDESFSGEHGANYPTTHTYATATSLVSPTRTGWTFCGWFDTAECDGTKLTSLGAEDYVDNITLYAKWELGYECSAAELSALLSTLSSANNPYKIVITDDDPDLSMIKSALQSNSSIEVNLDCSRCGDMLTISDLQNCTNLVGITIPDCVLSISESAFSGCSGLTNMTIPNSVTSIGSSAFSGCSGLTRVDYTGTLEQWLAISFGNETSLPQTFTENVYIQDEPISSVTSITIPDTVTSIPAGYLRGFTGLERLTVPFVGLSANATDQNNRFYQIFGNSYTNIPSSLHEVIITGGTSIGQDSFRNCSSLTSV
ncbi:MAG: InlB B-repeat-containing protein, partial [Spirochaetales bacterium]|nr:InlB B-repeat-containing protein [Spirochaetales bacterium]